MVVFFLEFFENIILFVSGKFWKFELGFFIEWKVFKVVFSILLLKILFILLFGNCKFKCLDEWKVISGVFCVLRKDLVWKVYINNLNVVFLYNLFNYVFMYNIRLLWFDVIFWKEMFYYIISN